MMRKDKDYLGIIIDGKWLREFSTRVRDKFCSKERELV